MKHHASPNHVFRLVWSQILNTWVAVAENAKGRGKPVAGRKRMAAVLALMSPLAVAAPEGGQITAGAGNISQTGATTTISQQSQRLAIDWSSFSSAPNEAIHFLQPNATAIALNRILGAEPSQLLGSLTANGQVFILNPNGVLFGSGARVNVGGLVASTLSLSNADFMAGNHTFSANGASGTVVNQGRLTAADGGYVALLGNSVSNQGVICATLGTALLAAGDKITLQFDNGSLVGYRIDRGALQALAENRQLLQAAGGQVIMTAQAADALSQAVVNNTGVIEAHTVQDQNGVIKLLGDMQSGAVNVAGTLDASAPDGGNGGLVETSAAKVTVTDTARITTSAAGGNSGTWLIDPADFTIGTGGDISGAALGSNLATTSVTILSTQGTVTPAGNGDIFVDEAITWNSANSLTLEAVRHVNVKQAITSTGTGSVNLRADAAGACVAGASNCGTVNFASAGQVTAAVTNIYYNPTGSNAAADANGVGPSYATPTDYSANVTGVLNAYMLVNDVNQLQAMNTNLGGSYALGRNVDAAATTVWNTGAGFVPVGDGQTPFTGRFDGQNHTIANLTINQSLQDFVGLFGYTGSTSVIRNVTLNGASITANGYAGVLVGLNSGAISNVSANGNVTGNSILGGLAGANHGTIVQASASGSVMSAAGNMDGNVGGLVGLNYGNIDSAQASNSVSGDAWVGGLAGTNGGVITHADASGNVAGLYFAGGLVGQNDGSIDTGHATGSVSGDYYVGGLAGANNSSISNADASGDVTGFVFVGGLVGSNEAAEASISAAHATGNVTGVYYVGGLAGENWATVGNAYATGNVAGDMLVGGLIGSNDGPLANAYASGNVTGNSFGMDIGGLAGLNSGMIDSAYAAGNVEAGSDSLFVGGLTGENWGTVSNVYAAGSMTTGANSSGVGGLTGDNSFGTVSSAYWNVETTGITSADGGGNNAGATGLTTAQMQTMASFAGWDIASSGGTAAVWRIYEGNSYPLLRSFLTPLTVTADAASKSYDGLAYAGGNGVSYSSVPDGNLLGSVSYGGTAQGAVNAGSYVLTPSGYYSNQQGYDISYADGTLTVNPAALTVSANGVAKTYDGLAYGGGNGVTYSGFVNGETATVLGGALSYGGSAQGAVAAGSYLISPGGLTSGNYDISYVDGALTVNSVALSVAANDATKTYDGFAYSGGNGVTYSGFVNGETATVLGGALSYGGSAQGAVAAGSYPISPGGLTSGNYDISFSDGTLTVNPAALTVTANDVFKIYDGQPYQGGNGVTYSGLVNGETSAVLGGALSYGGSAQGAVTPGNYLISPSGLTSANYTISYAAGALTINVDLPYGSALQDMDKGKNFAPGQGGVPPAFLLNIAQSTMLLPTDVATAVAANDRLVNDKLITAVNP